MQSDLLSSCVPTQLCCGRDHTLLIGDGSRLFGFGLGDSGQFGQSRGLNQTQAAEIALPVIHNSGAGETPSAMVAVGNKHSLILKDGIVYSCGDNSCGRLGLSRSKGKTEGRIQFSAGSYDDQIGFISCGPDHSVAISSDGYSMWCWGSCDQVGVGHPEKSKAQRLEEMNKRKHDYDEDGGDAMQNSSSVEDYINIPKRFTIFHYDVNDPHRIIQVSCGAQHTIALREDGCVYTWGEGAEGRLGHNGTESTASPRDVVAFKKSANEQVIQVCAGASHSMALDKEGKVWTWGSCNFGKLGHPELQKTQAHVYKPKQVKGITRDAKEGVISIHCSEYHSLAITNTHKLFIWGGNHHNRLGLGDPDNEVVPKHRWSPEEVTDIPRVIRAACGVNHTVAVTEQNQVFVWGQATNFRCGLPPDKNSTTFNKPRKIAFFDEKGIYKFFKESSIAFARSQYRPLAIATGDAHSLALCEGNQLVAWGSNMYGQLGTGQQTHSDRPIPLPYFIEDHVSIKQIACGANHSLALTTNGQMYSWGDNKYVSKTVSNKSL